MTVSQRPGRAGSPVGRVLDRSASALRNLQEEQIYALECLLRPAGAPRPRAQASRPAGHSRATAAPVTLAPAGATDSDRAA